MLKSVYLDIDRLILRYIYLTFQQSLLVEHNPYGGVILKTLNFFVFQIILIKHCPPQEKKKLDKQAGVTITGLSSNS